MTRKYTSYQMRVAASSCDEMGHQMVARMLRQAADAIESEKAIKNKIAEIDAMAVAPLDGNLVHQKTNSEKVIAKIEFFESVKEILGCEKTGRSV